MRYFYILFLTLCFAAQASNAQIISTVVGDGTAGFSGDGGPASSARLSDPRALAFDRAGNYYIANYDSSIIRKVNTAGIISTVAGSLAPGYSGDNGPATLAKLHGPRSVAVDSIGNLYIADAENNVVRKVDVSGIITTIAGDGTAAFGGDGGPATAAQLSLAAGVAVGRHGEIFIADFTNNRIRKVYHDTITTFAGTGAAGYGGDGGPATAAFFTTPARITVGKAGELYIIDYGNNRIRVVDNAGIIHLVAGTGGPGLAGDGGPATSAMLNGPVSVALDDTGNIYVADWQNNLVRLIDTFKIIHTIAGTSPGYSGDGYLPTYAQLNGPIGVALDDSAHIYIVEQRNNIIRKIDPYANPFVNTHNVQAVNNIKVYPNPTSGSCTIELPPTHNKATITILDLTGKVIRTEYKDAHKSIEDVRLTNLASGNYILQISAGDKTYTDKIEVR